MKKTTTIFLTALTIAISTICISCEPENINSPTNHSSSQPLTFEEMSTFRSMDQSAIVALMEGKGYRIYSDTWFINGNEKVRLEYNEYELLEVQYRCLEEGALSSGRMKSLFTDALNDAKEFCEDFTLDSTAFYASVNEERIPNVHTEEELLAFIDNCDASVMNDGSAFFYCRDFTVSVTFSSDEWSKRIVWNPTPRFTFNGTTWEVSGISFSESSGIPTIDLGDGFRLTIHDKIKFASETTGTYIYHRVVTYSDSILNKDSIGLPFTYSTEMLNDNEGFTAHISQLENIGIEYFSTMTQVSQGVGVTRIYLPEIEEEVTLLFSGSLNTIIAR